MAQLPKTTAKAAAATAAQPAFSPFRVDPDDEIPVGVQLDWRIRALISSGRLAPGDRLPSVRALASWAGVNVNTVRSVYAGLEARGIAATQHGSGTFVTSAGLSPSLERIAADAIAQARELGASARELAMIAFVCAEIDPDEPASDAPAAVPRPDVGEGDERVVREELRRQIGRLEALLAAYTRELPATPAPGRAMGQVAGSQQLERIRDELLAKLSDARKAAETRGSRERHAKLVREEMAVDPSSHRWEVVSDADMGEEGCRDYAVTAGPLGSLMSWWRLKVSGGCPLPGSA